MSEDTIQVRSAARRPKPSPPPRVSTSWPAAPPATGSGVPALIVALLGGLAVLLVAALVVTFVVWRGDRGRAHRAAEVDHARTSALSVARSYAVEFGSYDYRTLDQDFARVQSHLTPSFAKSYQATADSLRSTIVQYQGRSVATVQGAAVESAGTKQATVLVFLDQTVTSARSTSATVDRNRVELQLQLVKGHWLINELVIK